MITGTKLTQRIYLTTLRDSDLVRWIGAFLVDRKARANTQATLKYYKCKLIRFADYCQAQLINQVEDLKPEHIRNYLIYLEDTKHKPGGRHAYYRAIKAFLRWYELETEPVGWSNPIKKVAAPKVPQEIIEPVELDHIRAMIEACKAGRQFLRDKALLLSLLDTGVRAKEFLDLNRGDLDHVTGELLIRCGKGQKSRSVYIGSLARKAVRAYLKNRADDNMALWITQQGERLTYDGLRGILTRLATSAGLPVPTPHDFRRAFAINMLRAGVDLITLARLMGHTSLVVLQRYLKQNNEDLLIAHRRSSPADKLKS